MATIPLGGKHAVGARAVAQVDDDMVEDLQRFSWFVTCNGKRTHYYAKRTWRVDGKKFFELMHRRVLGVTNDVEVDHRNRDTLDNRRENLRAVSHSENLLNRERVAVTRQCKVCAQPFTFETLAGSVKREFCSHKCKLVVDNARRRRNLAKQRQRVPPQT